MAKDMRIALNKDSEGYRLMMRLCKPDKKGVLPTPTHDELVRLGDYCGQDVRVEQELLDALPLKELARAEQAIWEATEEANDEGILVDRLAVLAAIRGLGKHTTDLGTEIRALTNGINSTQVQKLGDWFAIDAGEELDDLTKQTLEDRLDDFTGPARRVAEIRLELAKSSTSKFAALRDGSVGDGRVRGQLIYHGAHTGRDTHPRMQLGNLPRGVLVNDVDALADRLDMLSDPELIALVDGSPMTTYSALVRPMLVAPPGKVLTVIDLSQIEARVLAWLAGETVLLDGFRRGVDVYRIQASAIYNIAPEAITKNQRTVGKVCVLSGGYGCGWKKFRAFCKASGVMLTEEDAKQIIYAYRDSNPDIVRWWAQLNEAIWAVAVYGQDTARAGPILFQRTGPWVRAILPSGRALWYLNPRVVTIPPEKPEDLPTKELIYGGRFKYGRLYGGLLAENITQAVARDVFMGGVLRLRANRFNPILRVHDEIVCETPPGMLNILTHYMTVQPSFAPGLPVKAEGFETRRYRK
jgi:DNA polymerase